MWNAGLDESQAGIKVAGININNLRYTDETTLLAESEEELKSLFMKVKEENEKADLKLNNGPITSWQIDGEKVETVTDFLFLGSKITADIDFNHEIRRRLLLGRKAMRNLDSVLKSRDIALLTKVLIVKAVVFPVVMYRHESWPIKKAEHQRIDTFELWYWRRLLRVPWMQENQTNQSIFNLSLERLMLKLKLQYFGHLMGRANSLEMTLMLRKIEGRRRRS